MAQKQIPPSTSLRDGKEIINANVVDADDRLGILENLDTTIGWDEIEGKPESYPPSDHDHDFSARYAPAGRETFYPVTLMNGAQEYNTSGYGSCGFYKDAFERVHLQGMVVTGGLGTTLFNLPAHARPAKNMIVGAVAGGNFGRVDIGSNGNVSQVNGATGWVSLTGITFMAAQ